MTSFQSIQHLLIDLDGTLYPIASDNDYEHHVRNNVLKYMHEKLGVPQADAYDIWRKAFAKYNQSLKGLRESGYHIIEAEYWDFIRQGAEEFLRPDPLVRQCLLSLPQHKWLFTNANEKSATQCLKLLNLEGIFEGIVGADSLGQHCKPEVEAFNIAVAISGADPLHTAMFEDSFKNLQTAKAVGMTTVLLSGETAVEESVTSARLEGVVDAVVSSVTESELKRTLPSLWHPSADG